MKVLVVLFLALANLALADPVDCSAGPPKDWRQVTVPVDYNKIYADNVAPIYPDTPNRTYVLPTPTSQNPFLNMRVTSSDSPLSVCAGYAGPNWPGPSHYDRFSLSSRWILVGQCAGSACVPGNFYLWNFQGKNTDWVIEFFIGTFRFSH